MINEFKTPFPYENWFIFMSITKVTYNKSITTIPMRTFKGRCKVVTQATNMLNRLLKLIVLTHPYKYIWLSYGAVLLFWFNGVCCCKLSSPITYLANRASLTIPAGCNVVIWGNTIAFGKCFTAKASSFHIFLNQIELKHWWPTACSSANSLVHACAN